jgi:hypothetical protein
MYSANAVVRDMWCRSDAKDDAVTPSTTALTLIACPGSVLAQNAGPDGAQTQT